MKIILVATWLAIAISSTAQNKLEKAVSVNVCSCVQQLKQWNETAFGDCFGNSMMEHSALITEQMLRLGLDTTEEAGYKFGVELYFRLSVSLVFTCPGYGKFLDELRPYPFKDMNRDSMKALIKAAELVPPNLRDAEFFRSRGLNHFLTDEFSLALQDFNSTIAQDSTIYQAYYLKGWALEKLARYDEAILFYDKAVQVSGRDDLKIFAALAEQKKRGLL